MAVLNMNKRLQYVKSTFTALIHTTLDN